MVETRSSFDKDLLSEEDDESDERDEVSLDDQHHSSSCQSYRRRSTRRQIFLMCVDRPALPFFLLSDGKVDAVK